MHDQSSHSRRQALAMLASGAAALALSAAAALKLRPIASAKAAYRRDDPQAEIGRYDAGRFALDTRGPEIGARIRDFLGRHVR